MGIRYISVVGLLTFALGVGCCCSVLVLSTFITLDDFQYRPTRILTCTSTFHQLLWYSCILHHSTQSFYHILGYAVDCLFEVNEVD